MVVIDIALGIYYLAQYSNATKVGQDTESVKGEAGFKKAVSITSLWRYGMGFFFLILASWFLFS